MKSKYIDAHLAREIQKKLDVLARVPPIERRIRCHNLRRKKIATNARINSFRMEHPEMGVSYSVPRNNGREFIKEGIKNLENAFRWGSENFDPGNFDESFIREIAGRITPELYGGLIATYRRGGQRVTGSRVLPPGDPYKVREIEMPRLAEQIKNYLRNEDIFETLDAALHSHLHLVRIHPFVDGNGRTARILQDVILSRKEIPVPIIEAGERNIYNILVEKAIYDIRNNEKPETLSEGEKLFYNFMAGKVNVSIDKVLNCKRRHSSLI